MITNNSIQAAKEEEAKNNEGIRGCSSSRQWSRLRNPRIVRVPRSFGGKDRHSKVCTVRGLRDRRIRLSVPTAIQLYDLQDKLGLNQPSKVVDWLLDETKEDIDKLPPLQIPPGLFAGQTSRNLIGDLLLPYDYQFPTNTCSLLSKQGVRMNDGHDKYNDIGKFWDMKSSSKQVMKNDDDEKGKSIEVQKVSSAAQSFFPTNAILPYSSNSYHYDQNSNLLSLSSSQFGTGLQQPAQADNFFNPNPMSLAIPSSVSHHLYLCPTTLPSLFPSYPATSYLMPPTNEAADTRQINHFQLLNSNAAAAAGPSQMPVSRYFQANVMNSKYLHHHLHDNINDQTQSDKGGSG